MGYDDNHTIKCSSPFHDDIKRLSKRKSTNLSVCRVGHMLQEIEEET